MQWSTVVVPVHLCEMGPPNVEGVLSTLGLRMGVMHQMGTPSKKLKLWDKLLPFLGFFFFIKFIQ